MSNFWKRGRCNDEGTGQISIVVSDSPQTVQSIATEQIVCSGLFWFAEQLLRSTVFSVLVFIRSHRTIHEPVPERKPVPCIRIVQTSVVAITSIHTRASSLVAVLMHRCFHLVMSEHSDPLWIYNDEVLVHQFKNCSVCTATLLEPTLLHQEHRENTILYSEEHPTIFVGFME